MEPPSPPSLPAGPSVAALQRLAQVLGSDVPLARQNRSRLEAARLERHEASQSRRFNNEVRDSLDHLYRFATASSPDSAIGHAHSIREHLRRASVESLEFLVEETLRRIRPLPFRWGLDRENMGEMVKRLLLVRLRHSTLTLEKIHEGQRELAAARQLKGCDMQGPTDHLVRALAHFKSAEALLNAGIWNHRASEVVWGLVFFAVGVVVSVLRH